MPSFVAVAHHEGRGRDRLADPAVVYQLATGLDARAEERIGRAADEHSFLPCRGQRPAAVGPVDGQRLLAMDVLARRDGRQVDLGMGLWGRQIDDDLDVGIRQQLFDSAGDRDVEFGSTIAGAVHVNVAYRDQIQDLEHATALDVGRADVAATDEADRNLDRHKLTPRYSNVFLLLVFCNGFSGSRRWSRSSEISTTSRASSGVVHPMVTMS